VLCSGGGQDRLAASAFMVLAPGPTAGAALAIFQLLHYPADAVLQGLLLPGITDPTDELVTGQECDVIPCVEGSSISGQRPP
jgi:hypothetical protein